MNIEKNSVYDKSLAITINTCSDSNNLRLLFQMYSMVVKNLYSLRFDSADELFSRRNYLSINDLYTTYLHEYECYTTLMKLIIGNVIKFSSNIRKNIISVSEITNDLLLNHVVSNKYVKDITSESINFKRLQDHFSYLNSLEENTVNSVLKNYIVGLMNKYNNRRLIDVFDIELLNFINYFTFYACVIYNSRCIERVRLHSYDDNKVLNGLNEYLNGKLYDKNKKGSYKEFESDFNKSKVFLRLNETDDYKTINDKVNTARQALNFENEIDYNIEYLMFVDKYPEDEPISESSLNVYRKWMKMFGNYIQNNLTHGKTLEIKILTPYENVKQSIARNVLIQYTKSCFMTFNDDDDKSKDLKSVCNIIDEKFKNVWGKPIDYSISTIAPVYSFDAVDVHPRKGISCAGMWNYICIPSVWIHNSYYNSPWFVHGEDVTNLNIMWYDHRFGNNDNKYVNGTVHIFPINFDELLNKYGVNYLYNAPQLSHRTKNRYKATNKNLIKNYVRLYEKDINYKVMNNEMEWTFPFTDKDDENRYQTKPLRHHDHVISINIEDVMTGDKKDVFYFVSNRIDRQSKITTRGLADKSKYDVYTIDEWNKHLTDFNVLHGGVLNGFIFWMLLIMIVIMLIVICDKCLSLKWLRDAVRLKSCHDI